MINQFYKFVLVNNSGQLLTYEYNGRLNLKMTGVIVTPATGKLAYANLGDDAFGFIAASTLAYTAEIESTEIDNTSNLYINLLVQVEVTHDEGAAADGTFDLYYSSGDATGELEVDADGYNSAELNKLTFVGSLVWESTAVDDELVRSPVFTV